MESLSRSLPSCQRAVDTTQRADPDVAARILKETKDLIVGQTISHGVNCLRRHPCNLIRTVHAGVAKESVTGRYPPLTQAVVYYCLIPTPPSIRHSFGQSDVSGTKPPPVELIQVLLVD